MGRFDEALRAYELATGEHPDNVIPKTGRARVLEAMGRFDEALRAYELAAREHPFDAGARQGPRPPARSQGAPAKPHPGGATPAAAHRRRRPVPSSPRSSRFPSQAPER